MCVVSPTLLDGGMGFGVKWHDWIVSWFVTLEWAFCLCGASASRRMIDLTVVVMSGIVVLGVLDT